MNVNATPKGMDGVSRGGAAVEGEGSAFYRRGSKDGGHFKIAP